MSNSCKPDILIIIITIQTHLISLSHTYSYELMLHCWEYKPENRPTFKQLHSKTVSYIERIAGYLEMNFTIRNPQIIVTDTSAPEAGETADQPHSGNESDSSDNESEAF